MVVIIKPTFTLGHIRPRANVSQTFRHGVNVTFHSVEAINLSSHPICGYFARLMQKGVNLQQHMGVFGVTYAAKVRNAANVPQELDRRAVACTRNHFCLTRQRLQRHQIIRVTHTRQPVIVGLVLQ